MKKYIILILMILFTFLSVNVDANTNYITILTFGEYGNREGEFDYPVGIAIDKNSNLYITDWENDRIQKFNSEGRLLKVIPVKDSELKIDGPAGIVLDQNENIIVVEQFNNRVHRISPEGKSISIIGKEGSGPGEFLNPRGIAIDKEYIKQFGREGMGDGEFYYPRGIALDDEGNIYVADTFHNQVQVFNNQGRFLRKFGEGGEDIGEFNGTRYIAFDSKGDIYITDYKNGKVVKFNKEEQFELEFGNESDGIRLSYPEGIAIDDRDYIFVVDAGNNSIVKYCLSKIVIHFNLGNKYIDEHKYKEAIAEFKQIIYLDPLNVTAREAIASAYYENEEWEKAIEAYNYLQNIRPDDQKIKLKIILSFSQKKILFILF
jgi:DNA-binding beta-propeller fold protein YncE